MKAVVSGIFQILFIGSSGCHAHWQLALQENVYEVKDGSFSFISPLQ